MSNTPTLLPDAEEQTPQELTAQARDISVTERNGFKTCRRRWYLDTIENLEPRGGITWYYEFGTGLHSGLEAFYKTYGDLLPGDPLDQALFAFEEWYEVMDAKIQSWDVPAEQRSAYRNELLEYRELGIGMLNNYNEFSVLNDTFVVCAVEGQWTEAGKNLLQEKDFDPPYTGELSVRLHESGRFLVPIVNPVTKKWVDNKPYLSARLDLVLYMNQTGQKGFWPMDHKSSGGTPSDRGLDVDDQITGYDYTFWRWTGIVPRGTFFNYLIKQLPKSPRILQGGKLSTAKDQLTIPEAYREAMQERGIISPEGQILSVKHEECYHALLNTGWSRFFKRFPVPRNEHELLMFERRLVTEHREMQRAVNDPTGDLLYPTLSQYVCPGCSMMRICQSMEDGSDYEGIIASAYQIAEDRKAV